MDNTKKVTIETHAAGVHFASYAVVRAADGSVLHTTADYPWDMPHMARRVAEQECLRRGWDDTSGTYVREMRDAQRRVDLARSIASQYRGERVRWQDIRIDDDGFVCGAACPQETLTAALSVPGMVDAAAELRRAVIALAEVV